MDKVRFTVGDAHVWQGFHSVGDTGMIGALVYVTADTLRAVVNHFHDNVLTDLWDRVHNGPSEDWDTLAFGDSGTILSPLDKMTPLYRLTFAEAVIVQRFNTMAGQTYDIHGADGVTGKGFFGAWVNEDPIDGIDGFETAPDDFEPVTHGFYIDAKDVAAGRSNAPLIDTESAKDKREAALEAATSGNDPDVLDADETEAAGRDSTGFDGDPRFPHRESSLNDDERERLRVYRAENRPKAGAEFYDHTGTLTTDPRCELGLCRECIDSDLSRGDPVTRSSLSPLDPSYLTNADYAARYRRALAALGVEQRPMDDEGGHWSLVVDKDPS